MALLPRSVIGVGRHQPIQRRSISAFATSCAVFCAATLCLLFTQAPGAYAQSVWSTFRDAPSLKFSDADWKLLRGATLDVLDDPDAKAVRTWTNAESGNHGVVQTLKSFQSADGRQCKQLRFDNFAGDLKGTGRHNVCRGADGTWRLDS
jgi:hypothetical protein